MGKVRKIKSIDDVTLKNALVHGDFATRLSAVVMGAGCFLHKQVVKGFSILAIEILYIYFMIVTGAGCLAELPSLGSAEQTKVWNPEGYFEYTQGDNSVLILLYGVATICLTVVMIGFWVIQMREGYFLQVQLKNGKKVRNFKEDILALRHENLHITLMTLPVLGITLFTIVPLIFMISMAFTSYSKEGKHQVLFDWVGLKNFARVLNFNGSVGRQFWSVLLWTLIWAILATFLNYFLGMILAMVINRKNTHGKAFWRFCFVLSIAVPQFVSLMIMRVILQPGGAVNLILQNMGVINKALPFMTDPLWARVTVIVINLWVGIPYTMLQVTGILQNIPAELYEAAKIDGAGPATIFFKITLPYMIFVTTPYLITTFTGNVNNFNVIYLLTGGGPTKVGDSAGQTDLFVTWLYKLTADQKLYNIGAVIGILTFIVLSIVALVTYRNSNSYKNEEAFM